MPRRANRAVKVAIVLLVVLLGGVLLSRGADRPADPTLEPAVGRTAVEGFGQIGIRIEAGATAVAECCALLAQTPEQHGRGLMHRRDMAGYDAMLFDFCGPHTGTFWMKDTPMPLSIAWFDASGNFVSADDMEPCLDRSQCPSYAAAAPYRYALEVPRGGLAGLGVGPGSRLSTTPACP
jgi:uncharacterized protein